MQVVLHSAHCAHIPGSVSPLRYYSAKRFLHIQNAHGGGTRIHPWLHSPSHPSIQYEVVAFLVSGSLCTHAYRPSDLDWAAHPGSNCITVSFARPATSAQSMGAHHVILRTRMSATDLDTSMPGGAHKHDARLVHDIVNMDLMCTIKSTLTVDSGPHVSLRSIQKKGRYTMID